MECANKVKVPFDMEKKYHPEYDGYSPGEWRGSSRPLNWLELFLLKHTSEAGTVPEWLAEAKTSSVRSLSAEFGLPVWGS